MSLFTKKKKKKKKISNKKYRALETMKLIVLLIPKVWQSSEKTTTTKFGMSMKTSIVIFYVQP